MATQYTQVRIQPVGKYQMKEAIRHDLRTKKEKRAINNNDNHLFFDGKIIKYKRFESDEHNEEVMKIGNKLIGGLDDIQTEHKKLYRKTHKQSLNIERTQSLAMGILTFSDSFKGLVEQDADKMMELGIKTIKDMAKELDTQLHYVAFHTDEKGLPHFQFFINNFNSKGKSIKANRSKEIGEKLQDMSATHFAEYGFVRGVSKEKSGRKHLSIEEYKEYMELKDKSQELKEEIAKLKDEKEELMQVSRKLYADNKALQEEMNDKITIFSELYQELIEIQDTNETRWYMVKLAKLVEDGKTKKLDKLIDKLSRHKDAAKKKYNPNEKKSNSSPTQ